MSNTIVAASPLFAGVIWIIFGVNIRTGRGKERISRGVRVSYAHVPRAVRIRVSNADFVMGASWLAFAAGVLFPSPLTFVLLTILLLSGYQCYSRHRDLRAAVKEIVEARSAD